MCLPLPAAFRSLPRPSSPRDAKASVVRPYTLGRRSKPSPSRLRCNSFTQTMQLSKIDPAEAGKSEFAPIAALWLVGVPGVEPGTSSLSGTRSNQLSYTPAFCRSRRLTTLWWRQPGSNRRHPACKAGALPTELCPRGTSLSTRAQAPFGPPQRSGRDAEDYEHSCRQD